MQLGKAAPAFELVRKRFLVALDRRLDVMEYYCPVIGPSTEGRKALMEVQAEAHKIAGTAATFGYVRLGDAAVKADQAIADFLGQSRDAVNLEALSELVDDLMEEVFAIIGDTQNDPERPT